MSNSASSSDDDASLHVRCPYSDFSDFSDEQSDSGDVSEDIEDTSNDGFDLPWPAADTFTDDTFRRLTLITCSELGSQRIRLVKIRPGPTSSMVRLDAKICFLDCAGEYIALSYTWGSPVMQRQVIINDEPRAVTINLWRFLSQARELPARFSGWLWIDALSIDQSDPWEKLEQVKIISEVFRNAEETISWLGPSYGNSDRAMRTLGTLSSKSPCWKKSRSLWASPTGPAILELCERAYWQRLWVLQELRASRKLTLMCGTLQISFESLKNFLLNDNLDERVQEKAETLKQSPGTKMVSLSLESRSLSLRSTLDETSHLRCTDPLDKVYAILSVVSSGRQDIKPDYTLNMIDLLNAVLRNMCRTRYPDLEWVRDQCALLECMFGVTLGSMCYGQENSSPTGYYDPHPLSTLISFKAKRHLAQDHANLLKILYTWCKRYGHKEISQSIYSTSSSYMIIRNEMDPRKVRNQELRRILENLRDLSKTRGRYQLSPQHPRRML
jgi:hypothetical protein